MDFEATTKEFTRSAEAAEGDTAMEKKRLRRVSFADTTAVHVFDRDEDYETPPDSKPGMEGSSGVGIGDEPLGFHGECTDSDDTRSPHRPDEDGDDEEEQDGGNEEHGFFVRRDADSSSPGSIAGSMTSNDDDNLFGPVSTSFIRSGRLSEVSDDNDHDITLDSTAFSMHFSNVLPLDEQSINSGGSPRTPTGVSEAKDSRGFIPLSGTQEKVIDFALPNAKSGGGTGYSSDMTLVAENSKSYDYGKLPPTLEVLLSEVNEAMQAQHSNDHAVHSLQSCSTVTGRGPPAGASAGEIDQVICSPVHKDKDDIHKTELPSVVLPDALETRVISLPSQQSGHHNSHWDHIPGSSIDRTRQNGGCSKFSYVSASGMPAPIALNAVQMSSESHEDNTHTPTGIQNGNPHMHSGLCISSLRAKREQLFDDASVFLQNGSTMQTPLSSKRKITLHSDGTSVIKNGVAKFESFEMEESIGSKSRTLLSAHDHRSHGFKETFDSNEGYDCAKPFNISYSHKDEQVMGISGRVAGLEMNRKLHIHGPETPSSLRKSGCDEDGRATTQTSRQTEDMIQIPGAGLQKIGKSLRSGYPTAGVSPTSSASKQKKFGVKENSQVTDTFSKLVSSPISLLGPKHSVPQDRYVTPLAGGSMKSNSLLKVMRSGTPLSHVTFSFIDSRKLDNQNATPDVGTVSQNSHKESVVNSINFYPLSLDSNHKAGKDLGSIIEKLADQRPESFPDSSKSRPIKESEELVRTDQSPSRGPDQGGKDIAKAFHRRDAISQDSLVNVHTGTHQDIYSPKKLGPLLDDNIVLNKRSSKEVPLADDTTDDPGRTPKIRKVMPITKANVSGFSPAQQRQHIVGDKEALGGLAWMGFLTKIIDGTVQPFSLSISKLNLLELDVLEDLVCELQKARKFERLHADMQTLGKHHDLGQKRMSEIRLLKETLIYEQAKLQLKTIKHDRLLKSARELQAGIHDFCKLQSSSKKMIDKRSHLLPVSVSNRMVQDEHEKVLSMRQELGNLDEKIKGFVGFLGTSCNIDGKLSFDESIKVICDNLDKRNHCRVIRQHLRLWRLIDVVNWNDQCDIVLSYCNLLSQRFSLKVTPASRFGVELLLDDANIDKSFPNMRASTAFHFVFKGSKGYKRLANIKCFQKATQATSFILGNLLDVLEEIQLAQIQNPNLMSSTFSAQSAGKLELQFYFLNLNSGKKVDLSLDMTCLNCAVYPSEPSELKIEVFSLNSALPRSVSDEILNAVRSVKGGHSLLLRLCRCVSQFIQVSKV